MIQESLEDTTCDLSSFFKHASGKPPHAYKIDLHLQDNTVNNNIKIMKKAKERQKK